MKVKKLCLQTKVYLIVFSFDENECILFSSLSSAIVFPILIIKELIHNEGKCLNEYV